MVHWTRQPIQDCTSTEQHPGMHLNGASLGCGRREGQGNPVALAARGKDQAGLTPTQQLRGMVAGRRPYPLVEWRFC